MSAVVHALPEMRPARLISTPASVLLRVAGGAFIIGVLSFLLLPCVLVVPISLGSASYIQFPPHEISLRWYFAILSDPQWTDALLFSLKVAAVTTVSATVIGTLASLALVQGRVPGVALVHGIILSPIIVPHVIMAIALYLAFAPIGLVG